MADTTKLIRELAALVDAGKSVDFRRIVEIHAEIKALHQSLRAELGEKNESVRAAGAAENLLEKIIREYAANTSAAPSIYGRWPNRYVNRARRILNNAGI